MKFVRENLFMICTAAIVVVGAAGMLVMSRSAGKQTDEYAQRRVKLSQQIKSLTGSGVNREMVEAERERVAAIQGAASEVADFCLTRNSKGYGIITFDVSGRQIEAFPINKEIYRRESLYWRFPQEYENRLLKLLEKLQPTRPPSDLEIQEEIRRMTGQEGPVDLNRPTGAPSPGTGWPRPAVGGDRRPVGADEGSSRSPYRLPSTGRPSYPLRQPSTPGTTKPSTADQQLPQEPTPQEKATNKLVLAKSREGQIYADKESLDVALAPERASEYSDTHLYLAQVRLWVQKDVIEAIAKTNRVARTVGLPDKEKGVPGSPIKRLVRTNFLGYVVRRAGAGAAGQGAPAASGTPVELDYLGGSGQRTSGPPTLTGRACNPLYDVVHYDFTVVAPASALPRLYENLRVQNFHTVLDVVIREPGRDRPSVATKASPEDRYYYGTDAVVEATITGEMLLLADWTRGRWNSQTNTWEKDYPDIMPKAFLTEISQRDAGALRSEDQKKTGTTASPLASRVR